MFVSNMFFPQVVCLVCRGNSNHSCDPCGKMFQRAWELKEHMQEEHGEGGEVKVEEEERRVTRTSARLGRYQEQASGGGSGPEDDEILILDKLDEQNKAFGEEEESKYIEACKRKTCRVGILRIKNLSPNEESESGDLSSGDFVKDLLDQILKNVVNVNIDEYVKEVICDIINNIVVPD